MKRFDSPFACHAARRRVVCFFYVMSAFWAGMAGIALAQDQAYQIHAWENFEKGQLSPTLRMGHNGIPELVTVFNYLSPDAPAGILDGPAQRECGRYGLRIATDEKHRFISLTDSTVLPRSALGTTGRALYQADVYLPVDGSYTYNYAVLAYCAPTAQEPSEWQFYRVGILYPGSIGSQIYFSYTNKASSPVLYKSALLDTLNVQRPGWHRLQIIFEGADKIHWGVDGQEAPESPIIEPTLTRLQAGVMTTAFPNEPTVTYYDNLSIQWSPLDLPLPISPWATPPQLTAQPTAEASAATAGQAAPAARTASSSGAAQTAAPGAASQNPAPGLAAAAAPAAASADLPWLNDTGKAWERCVKENRPILTLFSTPRANTCAWLDQALPQEPSSAELAKKFVLLRIDVNQLQGGTIARRLTVFKVPCFIVMGPDQREKDRVIVEPSMKLPDLVQRLAKSAP